MFLVSDKGVIVVDAPPSTGERLSYAIGNVTTAPVQKFVYSHSHGDHVGGAGQFAGANVDFIAHEETAAVLAKLADPSRPVPTATFHDKKTIKVGNQTLELSYKGVNHQAGNIFIYAPAQKILMFVDVIFPKWVPFYQLGLAESVPGFIESHDQVLEYDFDIFLGGHITRSGTRQDVEIQKEYVQDLFFTCKNVNRNFNPLTTIGPVLATNPGNLWAVSKALYSNQAELCANEVATRWIGRLAGADVFGFDHAFKMMISLVTDYTRTTPDPLSFQGNGSAPSA